MLILIKIDIFGKKVKTRFSILGIGYVTYPPITFFHVEGSQRRLLTKFEQIWGRKVVTDIQTYIPTS